MSAQHPDENVAYTARRDYLAEEKVRDYMPHRFSGALGRYRYWREQRAVNSLIAQVPKAEIQVMLDCPTGIGRWLPNLAVLEPRRIVGVDASPTMLKQARTVRLKGVETEFQEGVAEHLPFGDGSFDLVFCHALLKHLPEEATLQVMEELARVASKYIILTGSVTRGPAGFVRRYRRIENAFFVSPQWFEQSVANAGLRIIKSRKASTPVGSEYSYLLGKA